MITITKSYMELRQVRYFEAVARAGSFSRAAEELGLTQPALSRQVKALEEEWGWRLLERSGRGVDLTCEGRVALREVRRMLKAVEGGLERMRLENGSRSLRVGYAPSLAGEVLEKAVACFLQRHAGVRIELLDLSSEEMMEGLRKGALDLIIGVRQERAEVRWRVIREVEMGLVVQKEHPLARRRVVPAAQIGGEKLLLLSREGYPEYWEGVRAYFAAQGINAKVAGEFDGLESLLTGLRAGMGVALIGKGAAKAGRGKLVAKALDPPPPPVQVALGLAADREPDKVLAGFVEEVCGIVG